MRRKVFLSALAVMFVTLALSLTAANEAAAQQDPNCCTYILDINVPASCFPFNIHSFWGSGFPIVGPINANGVTVHSVPGTCPPSSPFFGASINGQFPIAAFGSHACYSVNGCNLVVRIGFDNGCTRIHVRTCP